MRFVAWILRLVVFILVLMFAMNNTGPVDVRFYGDHIVSGVPLIVVMLIMLVLGAVLALLVSAPAALRRRREAKKLRRDLGRLQDQIQRAASDSTGVASGAPTPVVR